MKLSAPAVLFATMGAGAAIAAFSLTTRRKPLGYTNPFEVYPLPPLGYPDASKVYPETIPSHPVTDLPKSVTAPTPLEVQQAITELSRGPQFTPAIPPPPAPPGTPDDTTAQMVKDLTAPATSSAQRSPRQAATDLYNYVVTAMRASDTAKLGTTAEPDNYVAAAQRDMRLVASDGVYGPKTAARGKELLGREFPARNPTKRRVVSLPATVINSLPPSTTALLAMPPPEPPPLTTAVSAVSPREAAAALFELVTHGPVDWGTKAHPNTLIRSAQHDMGGLTADGVYGPKTQARGSVLLSRSFPARK